MAESKAKQCVLHPYYTYCICGIISQDNLDEDIITDIANCQDDSETQRAAPPHIFPDQHFGPHDPPFVAAQHGALKGHHYGPPGPSVAPLNPPLFQAPRSLNASAQHLFPEPNAQQQPGEILLAEVRAFQSLYHFDAQQDALDAAIGPDNAPPIADKLPSSEEATSSQSKEMNICSKKEKTPISIVVIGHRNSGKSTTMSHLIYKLGGINEGVLKRSEEEAGAMNKSSFTYAWVLDKLDAEREHCITTDITLWPLETANYSCTLIDVPGHNAYTKNSIAGTSMADYAILMIDSTDKCFESGMNSQTLEQAFIAFNMGVKQIICCYNKMDATTPKFSEAKYNDIMKSVERQLSHIGYRNIPNVPISGLEGDNIFESSENLYWYRGATLVQAIDNFEVSIGLPSNSNNLLSEKSDNCYKVGGMKRGFAASKEEPSTKAVDFTAKVVILNHPNKIQSGYKPLLHCHSYYNCYAMFSLILERVDEYSNAVLEEKPKFLKNGDTAIVNMTFTRPVVVESFKEYPPQGYFIIWDFNQTVGFGIITSVNKMENSPAKICEDAKKEN